MDKEVADCSQEDLPGQLDRAWDLFAALETHAAYWKVRTLEDTQDRAAKDSSAEIDADQTVVRSSIEARLRSVPPTEIDSLGKYAYLARTVQADQAHLLAPDAEQYRSVVTARVLGDIADSYDALIEQIDKTVGPAARDVAERRSRALKQDSEYMDSAPVAASLLNTLVDVENRDAVARGFSDAAVRKYDSLRLTDAMVESMLAAVGTQADAYRHYQQVLANRAQKKLGVSAVSPSDLSAAVSTPTHFAWAEGRALILGALQPLGQDYVSRFEDLLTPANGRLDLSGGAHRSPRGTSIAAYDAPVALYVGNYDGTLSKLSTVAHEGGHAIHRELMNVSGIPIYQRTGPHFLNEGYAIFNELLLLDYAARMAKTRAQREEALERFLAKLSLELYVSAEETGFERSLYAANSHGKRLDQNAVDDLYRQSISPFEYWPISKAGTARAWMQKSLIFEDPLYLVNYLYAAAVAVALYEQSGSDPSFAGKYDRLLRRGFDADPKPLLLSIGIDLSNPDLIASAARLLRTKTDELESLYNADAQ
ncbi:MAG TPA: M3 family metallopeptidase [Candidatus Aquilonibacter sp.]|nr:M3 family metallopeptidase [Candidatus Aquilonibacter sp.]